MWYFNALEISFLRPTFVYAYEYILWEVKRHDAGKTEVNICIRSILNKKVTKTLL